MNDPHDRQSWTEGLSLDGKVTVRCACGASWETVVGEEFETTLAHRRDPTVPPTTRTGRARRPERPPDVPREPNAWVDAHRQEGEGDVDGRSIYPRRPLPPRRGSPPSE